MKTKKRTAIIGIALALVLAVGGTLAYLTAMTGEKENVFTMGTNITGILEEPNWDPAEAENFTPSKVIAKDPQIENTSVTGTDPAYVGATLTYQVKDDTGAWVDTTYAALDQFINIQTNTVLGFNTTNWTMADNNTRAYYTPTVAPGITTDPIFTDVEIDPLALTPAQIASVPGTDEAPVQFDMSQYTTDTGSYTLYEMEDFQIVVKGYLVQSEGFTDAQDALQTAFPAIFS